MTTETPSRPTWHDVVKAAAEEFCEEYSRHGWSPEDLEEVFTPDKDGFELGKALEDEGYMIDFDQAQDLDHFDDKVSHLVKVAAIAWQEQYNIQPPYPVGTMVDIGEITGIYEHEAATYEVKLHGHDDEKDGKRRRLVKFEDVRLPEYEEQGK